MTNIEFFKAVNYEWKMLQFSYLKLSENLSSEERNCYLECFLIHAKVLLEFLMGASHSEHSERLLIETKKETWMREREVIYLAYDSEKEKDRFRKFNALLSHIGKDRLNMLNEKEWNIVELFKTIKSLLEKYSQFMEERDKPNDWFIKIGDFPQLNLEKSSDIIKEELMGTTSDIIQVCKGFKEIKLLGD